MKKFRIAFIGTGGRSITYAAEYKKYEDIEIVALADPSAENRKAMLSKVMLREDPEEYDDWREMLEVLKKLDGVVICSPNYLHADQAVACLERGLSVALEKPLATTKKDCERILAAEQQSSGKVLLGFVLRSTPLYCKIKELITKGKIGDVVSVQADELVGLGVSSIMNRSQWRRYTSKSGGLMLEKSCHDMDILNWMVESRPVSLNSHGSALIFKPDSSLPQRCDECGEPAKTCQYYQRPKFSSHEDEGEKVLHEFVRQENRCIYNIDKDVVDVQNVCLEYENGTVANFMLNMNCMGPRASRNFHAVGKKGRIWGNLSDKTVFIHENLSGETTSFDAKGDGSGHGGGDRLHALLFRRMLHEPDYRPEQNAKAGYLSAVMCFAADLSRTEKRRVNFNYDSEGLVSFS